MAQGQYRRSLAGSQRVALAIQTSRPADPSLEAMPSPPSCPGSEPDEPLYLGVIDLFVRVTFCYFAIVGVALAIDFVRGDGVAFRSWISFAIQAVAAFVLATFVARRTVVSSSA